jgi:hypothetical protein
MLRIRSSFITVNLSDLGKANGIECYDRDCDDSKNRECDMAYPFHFLLFFSEPNFQDKALEDNNISLYR